MCYCFSANNVICTCGKNWALQRKGNTGFRPSCEASERLSKSKYSIRTVKLMQVTLIISQLMTVGYAYP